MSQLLGETAGIVANSVDLGCLAYRPFRRDLLILVAPGALGSAALTTSALPMPCSINLSVSKKPALRLVGALCIPSGEPGV